LVKHRRIGIRQGRGEAVKLSIEAKRRSPMLKQACLVCKIVGAVAIIGALNWGLVGLFQINLVEQLFGAGTNVTRGIYGAVGLSGILLLVSYFVVCPACKK
jgi:hypothetical protein